MNSIDVASTRAFSLRQIADLVEGAIVGSGDVSITGLAALDDAKSTDLGLFASKKYAHQAALSAAGALLVSKGLASHVPEGRAAVLVMDAHVAMTRLLPTFHPEPVPPEGVHPTAVLARGVRLGQATYVGPYSVIGEDTELGDHARIEAHVVIGKRCRVGARTVVHPQAVFYDRTAVGSDCIIHAGAKLGVDGFGYVHVNGEHTKVPQVGGCEVGDRVEIGANTCVDRGSIGDTRIGAGTKLDNLVHLAHNVRVGKGALLVAQVGIAGSTRIGDGVVFGGQSGASNHIQIGAGAQVAARCGVIRDVEAGEIVMGFPARPRREFLRAQATLARLSKKPPRERGGQAQGDA